MDVWQYIRKTAPQKVLFKGFDKARLRKRKTTIKRADGTITQGYRYFKEDGAAPELGHRKSKTLRDHESRGTTHGRKVRAVLRSGHSVTRQVGDLMHLGYYDAPHLREMTGASKKQIRDAVYRVLRKEKAKLEQASEANEAKIKRIDETLKRSDSPAPEKKEKSAEAKQEAKKEKKPPPREKPAKSEEKRGKETPPWSSEKANVENVVRNAPPAVKAIFDKMTDYGKAELLAGRTGLWSTSMDDVEEYIKTHEDATGERIVSWEDKQRVTRYFYEEDVEGVSREEMADSFPMGGAGKKGNNTYRTEKPLIKYLTSHNRIKEKEIFRGVVLKGSVKDWEAYLGGLKGKEIEGKEEGGVVFGGEVGTKGDNTIMDATNQQDHAGTYALGHYVQGEPNRISTRLRIQNKNGLLASPGKQETNEDKNDYHWLLGGKTKYVVKSFRKLPAKEVVGKKKWDFYEKNAPDPLTNLKDGLEIVLEQVDP